MLPPTMAAMPAGASKAAVTSAGTARSAGAPKTAAPAANRHTKPTADRVPGVPLQRPKE